MLCLLPLCSYLFAMATINYRTRPTVVSGVVDFWLLILGISGFLILGGAVFVSFFDGSFAGMNFRSSPRAMAYSFILNDRLVTAMGIFYLLLLVALFAFGHRTRRRTTAVYNATRELIAMPLGEVLDCPADAIRRGSTISLTGEGISSTGMLSIEESRTFGNLRLSWQGISPARQSHFESGLAERLEKLRIPSNPISGLLINLGTAIGFVGFLALVLLRINI